jgi:uncharacterized protein (TIGR02246 family)
MRKPVLTPIVIALAAILIVEWVTYAQGPDKTKEKSAGSTTKKSTDSQKPAGVTAKTAATPDASATIAAKSNADQSEELAEETAIRKGAEAFVAAFNNRDATAVGALFAHKAEITDEQGRLVKGRPAIEEEYRKVFEANPDGKIFIDIESIRILTPNIAVEEGLVRGQIVPDADENVSTYVAVHVKVEGQWLIGSVKDFAVDDPKVTANDHLQDLAWLVGEWVEESPYSIVHSVCVWNDNGNFLMQEFKVQVAGQIAMSGTMRIGWDAVRKQFKSWVFDSHGGSAEGIWIKSGNVWIVRSQGSTSAGETASATYRYRPIDGDTIGWSATDLVIDGELQDDMPEIIVKRRPPQPIE